MVQEMARIKFCPEFLLPYQKKVAFIMNTFFSMAQKPLRGQGPITVGASTITLRHITFGITRLDEWSARRRDLYLSTRSTQTDIHVPGGIRTCNPSKRAAADPRLKQRGYRDRRVAGSSIELFYPW